MPERVIGKVKKIITHGGDWSTWRSCCAWDIILIAEGIQCANCGAYSTDCGATWHKPEKGKK